MTDKIIEVEKTNNFWDQIIKNVIAVTYSVIYCIAKGYIAWILWEWFLTDYLPQPQLLTVIGICILVFFVTNNGRARYEGLKTYKDMLLVDSAYLFMALVTAGIINFW